MIEAPPTVYAELDVQALVFNAKVARSHAPQAKLMAVIKADAYGHGMIPVAQSLTDEADAFAVARVEEGVVLRESGCRQRIIVLEGFNGSEQLALCRKHRLETIVHCREQLNWLSAAQPGVPVTVWIKLDTGMNRLGFRLQSLAEVVRQLLSLDTVARPLHLMTHLACADESENAMTGQQLRVFELAKMLADGETCIANSAGLLAWPEAQSDWIRPGIMLYGISPFAGKTGVELGLKPVMKLYSRIIAIKPVYPGETVGYGGDWRCRQTTRLGVVAMGYGDGYPRQIAKDTPVMIGESQMPIIGRVSMDMLTVDLTSCDEAKVGDQVLLWGDHRLPVEIIATAANTIPYTLVCGITRRVKRVVVNEC